MVQPLSLEHALHLRFQRLADARPRLFQVSPGGVVQAVAAQGPADAARQVRQVGPRQRDPIFRRAFLSLISGLETGFLVCLLGGRAQAQAGVPVPGRVIPA